MGGLIDSLNLANSGLQAQQLGLDVTGQNLGNVNTVGYTRRTLQLAESADGSTVPGGGGVEIEGVTAAQDPFIDGRIRNESQSVQYSTSFVNGLAEAQAAFGQPGSSLDGQLSAFFDAFATLAQDPTSASGRQQVVSTGQALAAGFNDTASRLTNAAQSADQSIRAAVDTANGLITQIAQLNQQIADAPGQSTSALVDQRTLAIGQLTDITGGTAVPQADGTVNVATTTGRALVVGTSGYALTITSAPTTGFAHVLSGGVDITGEITSGQIGGLLHLRDTTVPGYTSQLDQLAYEVATNVNAIHQTGFGAAGGTNQVFFSPLASATGAASSIAVDPNVVADPGLVAASSTGAAGDNQTAQAIAALRNANIAVGGTTTAVGAWSQLTYRVGADVSAAQSDQTTGQAVLTQLNQLRDSVSGVSVDEEATSLMKYQMAYEASARYFETISQTLTSLMTTMESV